MESAIKLVKSFLPNVPQFRLNMMRDKLELYQNERNKHGDTLEELLALTLESKITYFRSNQRFGDSLPEDENIQGNILYDVVKEVEKEFESIAIIKNVKKEKALKIQNKDISLTVGDEKRVDHFSTAKIGEKKFAVFNEQHSFRNNPNCIAYLDSYSSPTQLLTYEEQYKKNFLHVKKEEILSAIKERYSKYEELMSKILLERNIEYSRIVKNEFTQNSTVVMIARISNIDKETKEIDLEYLDPLDKGQRIKGKVSDSVNESLLLFKNQIICFEGDYHDESILINKIFKVERNIVKNPSLIIEDSNNYYSILAFNGPFSLKESAKFIAFERIEKIVELHQPSILILCGPFYDEDMISTKLSSYISNEDSSKKNFDVRASRTEQLQNLFSRIENISSETKIMVIPDVAELDCLHPLPIPSNSLGSDAYGKNLQNVNPCSSPCIFTLGNDREIKIGYVSKDALFDTFKSASLINKGDSDKKSKVVEAIVEQHSMYPVPGTNPFDISKIHDVCYDEESKPDIIFMSSVMKEGIQEYQGTVIVNFKKTIVKSETSCMFTSVKIDRRVVNRKENEAFSDYVKAEILSL